MKRARGLRCGNFLACCFLGVGVNLVVMHVHLLLRMPGKLVLTILCVENFWEAPLFAQQNSADKAQLQCDRGLRCGSFVACCFLGVGVNLVVMHVHLVVAHARQARADDPLRRELLGGSVVSAAEQCRQNTVPV